MGLHDGHRERLRQQLLSGGIETLSDIQVLEYLLYFVNARKDTNPIAHALLDRFGSISAVLNAPVEMLVTVPGVGQRTAELIHYFVLLERRNRMDARRTARYLTNTNEYGAYLLSLFHNLTDEYVYLLCLDGKCKVLDCVLLHKGNMHTAELSIRKAVKAALDTNASSVILAHNHPSGYAVPSNADLESTRILQEALSAVGVKLVDHLVIADDDFVSMALNIGSGGFHVF